MLLIRCLNTCCIKFVQIVVKRSKNELDLWCELSLEGVSQSEIELRPRDWGYDLFSSQAGRRRRKAIDLTI